MTEGEAVEEPGMEKFATQPVPGVPYVASSVTFAEEPDREKLQFMPVASSNISGLFSKSSSPFKATKVELQDCQDLKPNHRTRKAAQPLLEAN